MRIVGLSVNPPTPTNPLIYLSAGCSLSHACREHGFSFPPGPPPRQWRQPPPAPSNATKSMPVRPAPTSTIGASTAPNLVKWISAHPIPFLKGNGCSGSDMLATNRFFVFLISALKTKIHEVSTLIQLHPNRFPQKERCIILQLSCIILQLAPHNPSLALVSINLFRERHARNIVDSLA